MSFKKITIFHPEQLFMLRLIRNWIMNTFGFSKSETNGAFVLICLIILIAILPRWFINSSNQPEVSSVQDKAMLREWYNSIKAGSSKAEERLIPDEDPSAEKNEFKLKPFNPNTVSTEDLLAMGLPKQVINNMVNYRNAGGSFRIRTDLQKIYGLDPELYLAVKDFILLPEVTDPDRKLTVENSDPSEPSAPKISISINQATAAELMNIKGIGPTLSERIIRYRNLLGGFHSVDQLYEVYGLKEEVILEMKDQIIMDSLLVKIDLNTLNPQDLSSHPYISYSLAQTIVNYHKVHGPYREKSDLQSIKIVSDSLFQKLSPYISVNPLDEPE